MFSKTLIVSLLILASLAATANAGQQNFVLLNNTGFTINEVYVSPRKARDWEEDVLGRNQLPNSQFVTINFDRSEKVCAWDLMVVYDDGEEAYWENFDLCSTTFILISYNERKRVTEALWR